MSKAAIKAYLSAIGRTGGRKSRRTLSSEQARAMVAAKLSKKTKQQKEKSK